MQHSQFKHGPRSTKHHKYLPKSGGPVTLTVVPHLIDANGTDYQRGRPNNITDLSKITSSHTRFFTSFLNPEPSLKNQINFTHKTTNSDIIPSPSYDTHCLHVPSPQPVHSRRSTMKLIKAHTRSRAILKARSSSFPDHRFQRTSSFILHYTLGCFIRNTPAQSAVCTNLALHQRYRAATLF